MRLAAVDTGTNTILLVVAEVLPHNRLEVVFEEERFVRPGEGVDRSGMFSTAAIDRVLSALEDYVAIAARLAAPVVSVGGTSASRDARNVGELIKRVRERFGLHYEVISGDEEALWSFRGALSAFPDLQRAAVLDVGGGSTEIVFGSAGEGIVSRRSHDIGAVRLTERCFPELPPAPDQIRAARKMVHGILEGTSHARGLPLVGSAGTVSALARLVAPDDPWQPLSAGIVREWLDRLLGLSADEVRQLDPELLSGRADVFAAGVLVVDAVMRLMGASELLPSPRGLRHGLIFRYLEQS